MGPQAHFSTAEMWSGECSTGPSGARGEMAVGGDEASRFDELVDELTVPVPAPREPARELTFGRDDGCAHAGAEEVAERFARTSFVGGLRVHLIPAGEKAGVPVWLLVDERPGHDRAPAPERGTEALQLLGRQPEPRLQVVGLGRACVREMAQQARPALFPRLHALELGAADRVDDSGDLAGH